MKLKTKLFAPLVAVLMLGTATAAFADLTCDVKPIIAGVIGPAPRAIVNGHWEQPADLQFTCTSVGTPFPAAPTTDASVTVYYSGLTITNTTGIAAGHTISVVNTAGTLNAALDTTRTDTGTSSVSNGGSLVAITIPNSAGAAPASGTFVLQNVVLSLSGGTVVGAPVNANLNVVSPTGNTTLTGSPLEIIHSVQPMLNSGANPPALISTDPSWGANAAQFTSAGTVPAANISCSTAACRDAKARFAVTVTEDHNDSWRAPATYYSNGLGVSGNGTNVLYTFSGMLPGSSISNCVLTPTNSTHAWTLTGSGIANSSGVTTLVAEAVTIPLASIQSALDTLTLACGTSIANPAYLPGASSGAATTPITVSMSTFPTGVALPGMGGAPATTGGTPRYSATGGSVGPVTVIQFGVSAIGQTMMLIPYALANVGSYDTGIAIANTTKDTVFGTDLQGAAPDTSGSISFNFYPGDGTSSPFTVTPTTGFNLNSSGVVASGATFVGNLSSILKAGNNTSPFQGYIIVVANFTHAHGAAYVYGGSATDRLTSATDVLVISNPLGATTGRGAFFTTEGSVEQTVK